MVITTENPDVISLHRLESFGSRKRDRASYADNTALPKFVVG